MAETVFHKGDQITYAYSAAQEVNLKTDGWVEGPVPPVAVPEVPVVAVVGKQGPEVVYFPPPPVDPAPDAQEAT